MRDEEFVFYDDIRQKKMLAKSAHAKASTTKGFKGRVRFASDKMSIAQINKLGGTVKQFNMYEEILTKEEYLTFNKEQRQAMITAWLRKNPSKVDLAAKMGAPKHFIYDQLRAMGIKEFATGRGGYMGRKPKTTTEAAPKTAEAAIPVQVAVMQTNSTTVSMQRSGINGKELTDRILRLSQIIDESSTYDVTLEISERL